MADPADRAAFQTLATVKEEPSDLESEAGDIKVNKDPTGLQGKHMWVEVDSRILEVDNLFQSFFSLFYLFSPAKIENHRYFKIISVFVLPL